jgi:hypothetical protein
MQVTGGGFKSTLTINMGMGTGMGMGMAEVTGIMAKTEADHMAMVGV